MRGKTKEDSPLDTLGFFYILEKTTPRRRKRGRWKKIGIESVFTVFSGGEIFLKKCGKNLVTGKNKKGEKRRKRRKNK